LNTLTTGSFALLQGGILNGKTKFPCQRLGDDLSELARGEAALIHIQSHRGAAQGELKDRDDSQTLDFSQWRFGVVFESVR
jgi:hypothetical protein